MSVIEKIGGYLVSDTRKITIYGTKCKNDFTVEVENDFKVTEEWVLNVMEDPEMYQTIKWLEKRGFIKDDKNVWNYDGNKTRNYNLPMFFIDLEKRRLRVDLGRMGENTKSIKIPFFQGGLCSIKEFPIMPKSNKFYMSRDVSLDFNENDRLSWFEKSFIYAYTKHYNEDLKTDINDTYFKLIFDMTYTLKDNESERNSILNWIKWYKNIFEQYPEFIKRQKEFDIKLGNFIKSCESIEKFKL